MRESHHEMFGVVLQRRLPARSLLDDLRTVIVTAGAPVWGQEKESVWISTSWWAQADGVMPLNLR